MSRWAFPEQYTDQYSKGVVAASEETLTTSTEARWGLASASFSTSDVSSSGAVTLIVIASATLLAESHSCAAVTSGPREPALLISITDWKGPEEISGANDSVSVATNPSAWENAMSTDT